MVGSDALRKMARKSDRAGKNEDDVLVCEMARVGELDGIEVLDC